MATSMKQHLAEFHSKAASHHLAKGVHHDKMSAHYSKLADKLGKSATTEETKGTVELLKAMASEHSGMAKEHNDMAVAHASFKEACAKAASDDLNKMIALPPGLSALAPDAPPEAFRAVIRPGGKPIDAPKVATQFSKFVAVEDGEEESLLK